MKRYVSLLLSLTLLLSCTPISHAASEEAVQAAQSLYELGLFNGTGTNPDGTPTFDLDRAPTRQEAIIMLVRLLGKEEEAKAGTWETPFTDVDNWAKPYVGYAYTNGLTTGTGDNTFGSADTVTASQYLTFVLRALEYESGTDFQWNKAWEKSDEIGLTDGRYNANTSNFIRGDVAIISKGASDILLAIQDTNKDSHPTESISNTSKGFYSDVNLMVAHLISYKNKFYEISARFPMILYYLNSDNEIYVSGDDDLWYLFDFEQRQTENPFVSGIAHFYWTQDAIISSSHKKEYSSPTEYITITSFEQDGKIYTGIPVGEYQDGDYGVHNNVRFAVDDGLVYFNINDLSDYFGLDYYFYPDSENNDCIVIVDK